MVIYTPNLALKIDLRAMTRAFGGSLHPIDAALELMGLE
jgi:hypothetical protein